MTGLVCVCSIHRCFLYFNHRETYRAIECLLKPFSSDHCDEELPVPKSIQTQKIKPLLQGFGLFPTK